uniref:Uncharacterized protein n=1 Tax=Lactuca sativa TaxID=4236 RepID=A0A9R1WQI3_LACSA|nr:hypothetical protein LSAT_V11C100037890 [Lactuca sativa]
MGYTDVLTTIGKVKKSCLPSQWNGLLTLLIKGLSERCGGSDTTSKAFLTILYGLYNGINLDYGSLIWAQVVRSLNTTARYSEISCGRFWTLITRRAMDSLDIPVMKDALTASIASFHTKKIIVSDPSKFLHYGLIPESMYRCVMPHSKIMADYSTSTPFPPRVLTDEQRAALEALDQPANRGKRVSKKEKAEKKETAPQKERKRRSSKCKSEAEAPSQSKSKKVKKMAKIMADYSTSTPFPPRVLTDEQRAALEALDQPANRGKRVSKKEKAEKKETAPQKERKRRSSKCKSEAEAPSQSKSKKVKKMAKIMADYSTSTPFPPRVLTDEQRAALEALDQPANRGKRVSKKEKAEKKETAPQKERKRRSSKCKSEAEAPSQSKSKKVKKMAKRAKGSPSSESEPNAPSETEAADPQTETTPVSSPQNPSSPKVTRSVPTSIPQTTTEPNIPFSVSQPSTSISTPIITESVTITSTQPPVTVNVSDTGAATAVETPVINLPSSPSPSSNSGATLGGDDEDFDSIYYSPYRIPTDTDADTPVTSQQLQEIHAKLDSLLADSKAYGGAVLKAFIESAIQTYTEALDRSTDAVDNSVASCSKATKEVSEVVHTTQIFLDSLKAHADSNASKFQASVDSFSATLQGETSKFEALRAALKTESTSFLNSLDSRFASLAAESTLKEELVKHQATIDLQKIQLAQAQQEVTLLQTQRAVLQSCAGDVKNMLTSVLDSHDPFLTLTIRQHLQAKLLPAITILSEMKGVSEKLVLPRQGGEEGMSKTELKGNVASGSGKQVLVESDSESDETITEALQHKKRDRELDDTLRIAREAEARERKIREDEEAIQAKKTLFPDWDRDTLITQAIEFPSIYWLEPIASFECENSKDSQFDMPITRKAFTFHCFDVTANVPHPNPKVDRELIDFYLKFGQPQYLTWSAQKIIKVKVLKPTQAGKFVNVNFKINRGTANTEHLISLANLPSLNLHDWILLYNILLSNQREYEPILSHLKRMLASYVHELATMDQEIAKVMNKKPTVKPTSKTGDIHKMKLGQIDSSNLTTSICFLQSV